MRPERPDVTAQPVASEDVRERLYREEDERIQRLGNLFDRDETERRDYHERCPVPWYARTERKTVATRSQGFPKGKP